MGGGDLKCYITTAAMMICKQSSKVFLEAWSFVRVFKVAIFTVLDQSYFSHKFIKRQRLAQKLSRRSSEKKDVFNSYRFEN